jgi:hypothetical protein
VTRGKRKVRVVRRDGIGVFVLAGGYVCRPPHWLRSRFDEGSHVHVRYLPDGIALVEDETWGAMELHDAVP